ncbi:hypothetical protein ABKN59_007616 [Abortiporus biennis]
MDYNNLLVDPITGIAGSILGNQRPIIATFLELAPLSSFKKFLKQDVLRARSRAKVKVLTDANITHALVDDFLESATTRVIGISASYGRGCVLTFLALASETYVLQISFTNSSQHSSRKFNQSPLGKSRQLLQDRILCNDAYRKLSIDMHRVATSLFYDHGLFITSAMDLQSLITAPRTSLRALLDLLGGQEHVNQKNACRVFLNYDPKSDETHDVSVRAWCAWKTSCLDLYVNNPRATKPIATTQQPLPHLQILASTVRIADRLHAMKPIKVKNDIEAKFGNKSRAHQLKLTRFKTRLRELTDTQAIVVEFKDKNGKVVKTTGRTTRVEGKDAAIVTQKAIPSGNMTIFTVGKEAPTNAEAQRTDVILAALKMESPIFDDSLVQTIYGLNPQQSRSIPSTKKPNIVFDKQLNPSQTRAVERILSADEQHKICLVQGPPGTGKTTVIAASTMNIVRSSTPANQRSVWLIAQSNVAVKNIAEKLAQCKFYDFKLLVSFEFHFDWHEHLYKKIEKNIIRSDTFKLFSVAGLRATLNDCRVILCTVSTLSHPLLISAGFPALVPLDTVIVDEASQIEVGDYFPMFNMFGASINKFVLIGDDKQLPPYGEEDIKGLNSIFEMKHLRKHVVFLDTQYRMPTPIGNFISKHVYKGRLTTQHGIDCTSSCRLVDVSHGEEVAQGTSWINYQERDAVIHLARKYNSQNKSYRIITPYDPQRGLLEKGLKDAKLPWQDKCFCVDSFQGNEADHIIISTVRSKKVGFLNNLRRSNVMLSRCKKSMVICTSRAYVNSVASSTLLAKIDVFFGLDGLQK